MTDPTTLRTLAEAATPGPWQHGLVLCLTCHDRSYLLRVIDAHERRRSKDEPPWFADLLSWLKALAAGSGR